MRNEIYAGWCKSWSENMSVISINLLAYGTESTHEHKLAGK